MTIRKGEPWGVPGAAPAGLRLAASDREAAAILDAARRAGEPPLVGLTGGLTWQLLGGPSVVGRLATPDAMSFPIDLGVVELDGVEHVFVGNVVTRTRTWRRGVAILNGQAVGPYRLGHRAHLNDGLLDLVSWTLSWSDLPKVASRARLGAHSPHPGIRERRVRAEVVPVGWSGSLVVDGERIGGVRPDTELRVRVVPDAATVVV